MTRLRMFDPGDAAALAEISERKSRQLGYELWLPPLSDGRNVTFTVEQDGKILGAHIFRQVHDYIVVGETPQVIRAGFQAEQKMREVLRARGVEDMVAFVPHVLMSESGRASAMERFLERCRFRNISGQFAAFEGTAGEG